MTPAYNFYKDSEPLGNQKCSEQQHIHVDLESRREMELLDSQCLLQTKDLMMMIINKA